MKKIITLFQRDYEETRLVYNEVVPGAEWVLSGEGRATVKIDGTACLFFQGELYKRYDAKKGRNPPEGFMPAQDEPDPVTGHWPGWLKVGDGPEDRWHREAVIGTFIEGATYELIGPKIQENPYQIPRHMLVRHGSWEFIKDPPRDFEGIWDFLARTVVEGIVWHRDNGDMVKIKRRDFGLPWP